MKLFANLILAGALIASSAAAGATGPAESHFSFSPAQHAPVQVRVYAPPALRADAPVVFALHGMSRDAKRVFENWKPLAAARGFVLVAPEFDARGYPDSDYNRGGIKAGDGAPLPAASTYAVIESLFDEVIRRQGLSTRGYTVFGHSAGAQFVHRAALLGALPRAEHFIAANAGWYTFPDPATPWPHGLAGLAQPGATGCAPYARDLVILLGEEDRDPRHPQLNRGAAAMAQGEHRLARGQAFLAAARDRAGALGCEFRWRMQRVPGAGHEAAKMAHGAFEFLP